MVWLGQDIVFPDTKFALPEGILALGGDLSTERLIYAYKNGIFPWFMEGDPIVWYCPPKRMVLFPEDLKISKSMKKVVRTHNYQITVNKAFHEVIFYCKNIERKGEFATWITNEMEQAYIKLYEKGIAKSIEVWDNDKLVGGLYGLEINDIFCGESMFSKEPNTSKLAFIHLVESNKYKLIDCQVYNDHLATLGAKEISRDNFLKLLKTS